ARPPLRRLHRRRRGAPERAAREALGKEAVGHHVRAGAAVRLGVAEAEIAELADALEERPRELGARVDRLRGRHHFGVHEPGDGAAELFLLRRELDHRRTLLRSSRVARSSTRRSSPVPVIITPYSSRAASIET